MLPEAIEAMAEASKALVYMSELRERAGEIIARVTGAEAGTPCDGASSGLAMTAAACMAGLDRTAHRQLPNTTFPKRLKNQVIVQHQQLIHHTERMRLVGAKIVKAGFIDRTTKYDIEGRINENTAAVFYCISEACYQIGSVMLPDVVEIAHRHNIPVIVDTAVSVDITYPIKMGADLAVSSGGKFIRGPSASGIIFGRKDLIEACKMTVETSARGMKIGKEEIVALITALELHAKTDWNAKYASWKRKIQYIYDKLSNPPMPHVRVSIEEETPLSRVYAPHCNPPFFFPTITVRLKLDEKSLGVSANDVYTSLILGDPSVLVLATEAVEGILELEPFNLLDGEEQIVVERIREVITKKIKLKGPIPL